MDIFDETVLSNTTTTAVKVVRKYAGPSDARDTSVGHIQQHICGGSAITARSKEASRLDENGVLVG